MRSDRTSGALLTEPLTWEAYSDLDDSDDLKGVELVDGFLEEGEIPPRKHGRIVSRLVALLVAWLDQHGGGEVLSQDNRVRIAKRRVRKPDIFLVRKADLAVFERETLVSAPWLVVEVVTATKRDRTRDLVTKRVDYEAIGARHYWIIDPENDTLDALSIGSDGLFGEPVRFGPSDPVDGARFGLAGLRFETGDLGREY
jgi:Uma2 family endonuclease